MKKERETVLSVAGMTCHSCIRHVDHALKELDGVSQVNVNLREGKVSVRHDESEAPPSALVEALAEAGYPSRTAE
jgi:copper ion binding protein